MKHSKLFYALLPIFLSVFLAACAEKPRIPEKKILPPEEFKVNPALLPKGMSENHPQKASPDSP